MFCHVKTVEKGLGKKWGIKGKGREGRRIHLLERALAAGGDVGEDVGETLSGHCERIVGLLVVCRRGMDGERKCR
jgi:hypothetical protein